MRLGDPKLPIDATLPRLVVALYDVLRKIVREVNWHDDWTVLRGSGSPEGVVTAKIGRLYVDSGGGASTTLYVKTADDGLNTGWTVK